MGYRVLVTSRGVIVADRQPPTSEAAYEAFAQEMTAHPDCDVALSRNGVVVVSVGPRPRRPA